MELKLERSAKILLKVQEALTAQTYFLAIAPDSRHISHPLNRLLGSVKLRLAQVNSTIGVLKNSIRA